MNGLTANSLPPEYMIFKTFIGKEIESVIEELGRLRIAVFRAFPYLYEGSLEYEKEYLKVYTASEKSFLFSVWEDGKMVGATTCIPLMDESEEVHEAFDIAGLNKENIFYFGESILLPQYRGRGLGKRFFEEREAHARSFNTFEFTCFCGVVRPENHPLRPKDYVPLDEFWKERGYEKQENLKSWFEWQDIDEQVSSPKTMVYWMKKL